MRVSFESKIQGAITGVQADVTMLYTKNVNPVNAEFLKEVDDPDPVPHASICMFKSPTTGKFIVLHWQTGFVSFPANGRYYCTRAMYEADAKCIAGCNLNSLFKSMPMLQHFSAKAFDADTFVVSVDEREASGTQAKSDKFLSYIWCAIASDKRLFIKLDNPQGRHDNALLSDHKLHSLLSALNALPDAVRGSASVGFSLKARDARKTGPLFDRMSIVAYYPDSSCPVDTYGSIEVDWMGDEPVCSTDLEGYVKMSEDLQAVCCLLSDDMDYADWNALRSALVCEKQKIDNALDSKNLSVLRNHYDKSCGYRRIDVLNAIGRSIYDAGVKSLEDVSFLKKHFPSDSAKWNSFIVKTLKDDNLSAEVRRALWDAFKNREEVTKAMAQQQSGLTIKQKYEEFDNRMYSLTYEDLSLDKASDADFAYIYKRLDEGKYKGVELKMIPNSSMFPKRYVRCQMEADRKYIESEQNRKFIKTHKLADADFVEWVVEKKFVRSADAFLCLTDCLQGDRLSALIKFLQTYDENLTFVEIMKLKMSRKYDYNFDGHLSNPDRQLGDVMAFCAEMSPQDKIKVTDAMRKRQVRNLDEWKCISDALGECVFELEDRYVTDPQTGKADLKALVSLYRRYSDSKVRKFIEEKVLSEVENAPEDRNVQAAVKDMQKVSKDFRRRTTVPLADKMLSRKGAIAAWCIAGALFVIVIVLASVVCSGGREEMQVPEETAPREVVQYDDSTAVSDVQHEDNGQE